MDVDKNEEEDEGDKEYDDKENIDVDFNIDDKTIASLDSQEIFKEFSEIISPEPNKAILKLSNIFLEFLKSSSCTNLNLNILTDNNDDNFSVIMSYISDINLDFKYFPCKTKNFMIAIRDLNNIRNALAPMILASFTEFKKIDKTNNSELNKFRFVYISPIQNLLIVLRSTLSRLRETFLKQVSFPKHIKKQLLCAPFVPFQLWNYTPEIEKFLKENHY